MSTSNARRQRRAQATATATYLNKLGQLLDEFFKFLDGDPQPPDDAVRKMFIYYENRWKRYCFVHKLTDKATLMFNQEVAVKWRTKYATKPDPTET